MNRLLGAVLLLSIVATAYGIRCWECSEARDDAHCRSIGKLRECMFNQDACEIELRQHEGWGGNYYIYKHCKQSKACDNNHIQNPRAAWEPSQCNPDDINSVCRCCCYQDECNVARDACFTRRGCYALPLSIAHGSVSCSSGFEEGSTCTVSCESYAVVSGVATTFCRADGTWSNDLAQCLYNQCEPRNFLANGWFVCSNGYASGSTCSANCRPGFTLVGMKSSTCLGTSMTWSSGPPTCRGLQCPDRGVVEFGTVVCDNENNLQSHCNIVCDDGMRLVGISSSYCQDDGQWSHPLPTCVLIQCPARGIIDNGVVSCTAGTDVNSVCTSTCDAGFVLNGDSISTCLGTGFWDRALPRCDRIMCPPRGGLLYGTVFCTDGSEVGSECTAACGGKLSLVGSPLSVCLPDGSWDVPLPVCQEILCPELTVLENGYLECDDRNVDDECLAFCNRGKRMVGSSSRTCLPSGEWSTPLPVCEDIVCPSLAFNQPGIMTCTNSFFYNSRCRFQCDSGFVLIGAPYVGCRHSGRWTTRMPECKLIVCRNRGRVARGTVTCSNVNNVGSTCGVQCDVGFRLVGAPSSTCTPRGRWNRNLPTCQRILCPRRDFLAGGTISCTDGRSFGSVCTATCLANRELIGARFSACLADGTWDEFIPVCRNLPCPDQGVLDNGQISCTNSLNVGSRCSFQCTAPGYELYPSNRLSNLCQPDQLWSVPKPCCTRPCPPFAMLDMVLVLDSSSSIGAENWVLLTAFVEGVLKSFRVAPDLMNIALFRYNREVDTGTQIFLNSYPDNIDAVIAGLRAIPYDGSGTFTGVALDHALTESLSVANGNRPDVPDLVLLVTDGKAADDVKTPADSLRAAGVQILVLGIEPPRGRLDEDQLLDIAGSSRNLIVARDGFGALGASFVARLGTFICGEPCT